MPASPPATMGAAATAVDVGGAAFAGVATV